jgi:hypothetical protein
MEFTDSLGFTIRIRLHPAMYKFALACRTFDLQYAKTSNKTFTDVVEENMFRILHWCRKLAKLVVLVALGPLDVNVHMDDEAIVSLYLEPIGCVVLYCTSCALILNKS